MKNILFSTTRQFNPGDEFILFGITNLLDKLALKYNKLMYNRHPMITPLTTFRRLAFRKMHHSDNSFFLDTEHLVDYIIIAGSPEWRIGRRMRDLFHFALTENVRTSFLAIGAGSPGAFEIHSGKKHDMLKKVLSEVCELLTVRDEYSFEAMKSYHPILSCCTALFASKIERTRKHLGKIGLVFQNCTQRYNSVSVPAFRYLTEQYQWMIKHFGGCELICHTMHDVVAAKQTFPDAVIRYSAFSEDFLNIYDEFDLIIGPRVHGAGMASSLGIPNIIVQHSGRTPTAKGFKSKIVKLGTELKSEIDHIDIEGLSEELIRWKKQKEAEYLELLKTRTTLFP